MFEAIAKPREFGISLGISDLSRMPHIIPKKVRHKCRAMRIPMGNSPQMFQQPPPLIMQTLYRVYCKAYIGFWGNAYIGARPSKIATGG